MKVVTAITDEANINFQLLRISCALNDLELVVIVVEAMNSLRVKDELLKAYLQRVDSDEVILFSDGYDAIFLAGEFEILEKFNRFNSDLVFSAEENCWPDESLASRYPVSDAGAYKFLNSGGFIGKAGVIAAMLRTKVGDSKNYRGSNQYVWTRRFLDNQDVISLDTQGELFCTLSSKEDNKYLPKDGSNDFRPYIEFKEKWFTDNFEIQNGRLYDRIRQTWPSHAHFNGFSKCLFNNDIKDMLFYRTVQSEKTPAIEMIYATT
jgi:hypothetical protein